MKRRRSPRRRNQNGHICWATAFLVGIATLHSIRTIEYGESYIFAPSTRPSTTRFGRRANERHTTKPLGTRRPRSIGIVSGLSATTRTNEPVTVSPHLKRNFKAKPSQYLLYDHELLTKEEEYDLGCKIRKFFDTKDRIDEITKRKKTEEEMRLRGNERRRLNNTADRLKRREEAESFYGDDLSMEEELVELLIAKGLNENAGSRSNSILGFGNQREDLYDGFEDDEQAAMEELGIGIYGIDNYNDRESFSDDLAIVDYHDFDDFLGDDAVISVIPESKKINSSRLGDMLDDIGMLTEHEIEDELGVKGGERELVRILIQGALAEKQMVRGNVRLVTSIARKWMGTNTGSGHRKRNADFSNRRMKKNHYGDWSTPSMDEVIQQGIVGLARAVERFEPERGFKFSTYATFYITNEIRQIFQSSTTQCLYVPPYFYTIKNKYEKIVREHYEKTAGDPEQVLSLSMIAAMLELKPERLQFILKSTRPLVQLDAPVFGSATTPGKGGSIDLQSEDPMINSIAGDEPSPEAAVEKTLLRQCIENAMAAELQPLERDIVRLRHGLDDGKARTIKEVIASCGGMLTVGEIRTAESRAYKKLRFKYSVHNARLRDFAEDFIGISPELLETAQ